LKVYCIGNLKRTGLPLILELFKIAVSLFSSLAVLNNSRINGLVIF